VNEGRIQNANRGLGSEESSGNFWREDKDDKTDGEIEIAHELGIIE